MQRQTKYDSDYSKGDGNLVEILFPKSANGSLCKKNKKQYIVTKKIGYFECSL